VLNAIEVDEGVLARVQALGEAGWRQLLAVASATKGPHTPAERAPRDLPPGRAAMAAGLQGGERAAAGQVPECPAQRRVRARGGGRAPRGGPAPQGHEGFQARVTAQAHAARCLAEIGDQQTLDELERWRRDVESLELKRVAAEAGRRLASQLKQLTPE
jgi:hypothetical protein